MFCKVRRSRAWAASAALPSIAGACRVHHLFSAAGKHTSEAAALTRPIVFCSLRLARHRCCMTEPSLRRRGRSLDMSHPHIPSLASVRLPKSERTRRRSTSAITVALRTSAAGCLKDANSAGSSGPPGPAAAARLAAGSAPIAALTPASVACI